MVCTKEFLHFSNLDDKNFILTAKGKNLKFTNVAKKISNKTQLLNQINLTTCEDNITKCFHNEKLRDLLQLCQKKSTSKRFI